MRVVVRTLLVALLLCPTLVAQDVHPSFLVSRGETLEQAFGRSGQRNAVSQALIETTRTVNPHVAPLILNSGAQLPIDRLILLPNPAQAGRNFIWFTCRDLQRLIDLGRAPRWAALVGRLRELDKEHSTALNGRPHSVLFHVWVLPLKNDSRELVTAPNVIGGVVANQFFSQRLGGLRTDLYSLLIQNDNWVSFARGGR